MWLVLPIYMTYWHWRLTAAPTPCQAQGHLLPTCQRSHFFSGLVPPPSRAPGKQGVVPSALIDKSHPPPPTCKALETLSSDGKVGVLLPSHPFKTFLAFCLPLLVKFACPRSYVLGRQKIRRLFSTLPFLSGRESKGKKLGEK